MIDCFERAALDSCTSLVLTKRCFRCYRVLQRVLPKRHELSAQKKTGATVPALSLILCCDCKCALESRKREVSQRFTVSVVATGGAIDCLWALCDCVGAFEYPAASEETRDA